MSAELAGNSKATLSPTAREIAATIFRRPRLVAASFSLVLLTTMCLVVFSPRYESHFKVLLRRGRMDPIVSPQPPSAIDFTRSEIAEEELNSEVELLRDEDLLTQVVQVAGLVAADTPAPKRRAEIEHAVRKLSRRLDVTALKKSNLIQVRYEDTDAERAARILSALSTLYVRRRTSLQRPLGEAQFFDQQTEEYQHRLQQSEASLVRFTRTRGVVLATLERDIALQKLGDADASYRQLDQDRVETERRITSLQEQLTSFPSRSVTLKHWGDNPQVLEKMKTHLLELQLKRMELLSRFEPSYRLVQEAERQIAETRTSIAAEALTPVRDETTDKDPNYEWARMELERSQVQFEGLQARESEAGAQVAALRELAQRMQSDSFDQQDLMRATKAAEDNYLFQQLFFRAAPTPVRHVGVASVEASTATASLCFEIARVLAEENRYDVALIDAQAGPTPLQDELKLACPNRTDTTWAIGPHLWMVPRQSWLPDISAKRVGYQNLSGLREIAAEFDFSILWCAAVSWITASIGSSCDGLVLVLTADKTRRIVAAQVKDQLAKAQVPLLGTVLAERRFPVPEGLYRCL